ncbi:tyrosine-protein kinase receptor UFO isoform X2 [Carcharodon carcharias]|uniref:tyrosine-protein kinase receptor UFO isoform X2 n=1 Tax=Carcharodon carcharias TaxID=13397 RepID=UPI001B7EEB16|nr:tyrosine-protein kinase receptor UFO isoform X2 [Carcharodon carcharias]
MRRLWLVSFCLWIETLSQSPGPGVAEDVHFLQDPESITYSQGKAVKLRCSIQVTGELPEINWQQDGLLYRADVNQVLVPMSDNEWLAVSELSIPSTQHSDAGSYRCVVTVTGKEIISKEAQLEFEGLPHFTKEPQDISVHRDTPFNLSCAAMGSPELKELVWLQDGVPVPPKDKAAVISPSTLSIQGLKKPTTFRCEASNAKGVATSRTAAIKLLPEKPENMTVTFTSSHALGVSWNTGFSGFVPFTSCTVQAELSKDNLSQEIYLEDISLPPFSHVIRGLMPHSQYRIRLACSTKIGTSPWTSWVTAETFEGEPDTAPSNITFQYNGSALLFEWEKPSTGLNGILQGYKVAYQDQDNAEVVVDNGMRENIVLEVVLPITNLTVCVAAYTKAGDGPWSDPVLVTLPSPGSPWQLGHPVGKAGRRGFSWHWWYVVMAVTVAMVSAIFITLLIARLRKKDVRYGEAFEPMIERGELVVRYRVKKSYSRKTNEATLNTLGISDDLKEKLRDVMIDRHKLALGKTLGEGEFGSVMEGQLNQDDYILKVAVKTMKIAICTRTEMEDFLREAICMKEFDHPNVMRLLGVCLQNHENEGFPSPVVILPFMKHGDLHSFLLYSRLGESPLYLPMQTLVKFMADIARGMEYLSNKNFIHRDLAARNCMLNENMNVCVADFGLSKKIYNGDYYRQGRISKMPVKWIAIESLADRVYTTKSDVWSYGVTMWEIATRGQTPYPGVENSEIYDYLQQGNRLKQPPDCLDALYELMFYCWQLNPRERPTFEIICCQLEKILEDLPPSSDPEEILYVNMEDACGRPDSHCEQGAVGGGDIEQCLKDSCLPFSKAPLVTSADVHQSDAVDRYVLCPPHETARLMAAVPSSSNVPPCLAAEDIPLEEICGKEYK